MDYNFEHDALSPLIEKELDKIKTPLPQPDSFYFFPPPAPFQDYSGQSLSQLNEFCSDYQNVENYEPYPVPDNDIWFSKDENELKLNIVKDEISEDDPETKIIIRLENLEEHSEDVQKPEPIPPPTSEETNFKNTDRKYKPARGKGGRKSKKKIQVINQHNLKRHDVVLKSILRSMRRYLCKEFLLVTKFKKTEKQHRVRMDNLVKGVNKMVSQMEFPIEANNYGFYFLALSYPGELRKLINDTERNTNNQVALNQASSVVNLVENVLNRFSKKIFKHFMEIPEISALVQHFLVNAEDLESIEGFEPCITLLDEKSKGVISSYADNPEAFSSNPYWIKSPFFIFNQN